MPYELPYLASYKNVGTLFERIKAAKVPEAFTQQFLKETLGLKSSADRALIALLKQLGMLDSSGKPTPRYSALKNDSLAGQQIAEGIREAYAPLFDADENAHERDSKDLKGLIAQVAGTDKKATDKIAWTFNALLKSADFSDQPKSAAKHEPAAPLPSDTPASPAVAEIAMAGKSDGLRPEFHYNIQVHLPANGSEETYLNIFSALRRVFK